MFDKKLFIIMKTSQYSISIFLMWLIYSYYKVPVSPYNGNYVLSLLVKFNVINFIIYLLFSLIDRLLDDYLDEYLYGEYTEDSSAFFGVIFAVCISIATLGEVIGIVINILFY